MGEPAVHFRGASLVDGLSTEDVEHRHYDQHEPGDDGWRLGRRLVRQIRQAEDDAHFERVPIGVSRSLYG